MFATLLTVLLVVVAAAQQASSQQQLFEGAECYNRAVGRRGVCRRVGGCAWALQQVQSHRNPQTCGWAGVQPLVCCPAGPAGPARPANGFDNNNPAFLNAGFTGSPFGGGGFGSRPFGASNGGFGNNPFLNGGFTNRPPGGNNQFGNNQFGNNQFGSNPWLSGLGGFTTRPPGGGSGGFTNRPSGVDGGDFSNRPTGSGGGGLRPPSGGSGGFNNNNRPTTNRPTTNRPTTNWPSGGGNNNNNNNNRPSGGSAGLINGPVIWETEPTRPTSKPSSSRPTSSKPTSSRPTSKPAVGQRGKIAKKKCAEYAEYVFREDESYALSPLAVGEQINECAVPGEALIVGGESANAKEFPHMALIGYGDADSIEYLCGGSLIAPDFVLTAAHCLITPGGARARWVLLGELDRSTDTDDAKPQLIEVGEAVRHPSYKPPEHYFDIALLRLKRDADLSGYVRPACLHTERAVQGGKDPLATGWGHTEWAGDPSDRMMKVSLPVQPYRVCNESYRSSVGRQLPRGILDDTQLCAGNLKGGKDTCQGDSGGPLQIFTTEKPFYCMHHVIGITSFGKACGFRNSPAIYTRVSYFVPWIESIVWAKQ